MDKENEEVQSSQVCTNCTGFGCLDLIGDMRCQCYAKSDRAGTLNDKGYAQWERRSVKCAIYACPFNLIGRRVRSEVARGECAEEALRVRLETIDIVICTGGAQAMASGI